MPATRPALALAAATITIALLLPTAVPPAVVVNTLAIALVLRPRTRCDLRDLTPKPSGGRGGGRRPGFVPTARNSTSGDHRQRAGHHTGSTPPPLTFHAYSVTAL